MIRKDYRAIAPPYSLFVHFARKITELRSLIIGVFQKSL
jgi:hypothetical protein